MNIAVGLDVLLNWLLLVLGPLNTDHAPVPIDGAFPESVADPVEQIVCPDELEAVVGGAITVMVASKKVAVQGALLIVHLTT